MKNRKEALSWMSASRFVLLCVVIFTAVNLVARGSAKQNALKNKKASPKYGIASGADQVLSSIYDPSTRTIRVEGAGVAGGSGTVSSVGLSMPSTFSVTGAPITTTGVLSVNWAQPVGIANGGTGQTSAAAGFNSLAPPTSSGGLIYGTGVNTYGNLSLGVTGQCLGSNGTTLVWTVCGTGSTITFGGDLSGTSASQTVTGLQGHPVSPSAPASGQVFEWNAAANAWTPTALPAFGTVSSVGLTVPSIFNVTGSPITSSGALALSLATQTPNTVLAGPSSGAAGPPAFRALAGADIPAVNLGASGAGGIIGTLGIANGGTGLTSAGPSGECLASNGVSLLWTVCGTAGSPSVFQVNGASTSAQTPVNFQSGGYITVTNPSVGNIQFNFSGPLGVANGGTGLTSLGASGQCLGSNGTTVVWQACGASGPVFQTNGTNNASPSTLNLVNGANITFANTSGGTVAASVTGTLAISAIPAINLAATGNGGVAGTLPIANGGNGTATPGIAAGQNIAVTGTWPNPTLSFSGDLPAANGGTGLTSIGTAGQCLQVNSGGTALQYGACATGGTGSPGGASTQVQFDNSGAFGGSANLTWNNTTNTLTVAGTVTATSFQTVGTGAGNTQWTSGPMSPGPAGTVTCGANANSYFACSFNGGAVTLMPALANDLGGTDPTNPQVIGFHLITEGQTGNSPITFSVQNDTTTGTTQYALAKVVNNSGPAKAILVATTDTAIPVYMTASPTGISGNARLVTAGTGTCTFDGAGTAGDYVIESVATAGDCHDAGAAAPTAGWVVGQLTSSPAAAASTGTVKALGFNAASGGSSTTFQVNGTSTSTQSPINFQSGSGVAVTNPSSGNVSIAEAPAVMFFSGQHAGIDSPNGANVISASGFYLPYPVTFSHIEFIVNTVDPSTSDFYDVGVYSHAGALEADIGAMNMTAAGPADKPIKQGSITLSPGQYYLAVTGNAATANFDVYACASFYSEVGGNFGSSTSGALPVSFTPPADVFTSWDDCFDFILH